MGKEGDSKPAHDYYGSIAGMICAGPVDALCAIISDSKVIWPKADVWLPTVIYQQNQMVVYGGRVYRWIPAAPSSPGVPPGATNSWSLYTFPRVFNPANPAQITVEGFGQVDFYWGTSDQILLPDPKANHPRNVFIAQGHPPYRNQCWALLWNFLWGRERQSAPSVEFVVRRGAQTPLLPDYLTLPIDGQVNPVSAELEILTHPIFGLGLLEPRFNMGAITAQATLLQAKAADYYLSITLKEQRSARALISDSMAYRDGWWRFDTQGRFEPGIFPHNQPPPAFTDANIIDEDVAVEDLTWDEHDWSETASEIACTFTNPVLAYKSDVRKASSGYSKQVTSEVRQKTLDRAWVLRPDQAAKYASEYLKFRSEPWLSGSTKVRPRRLTGIAPGQFFLIRSKLLNLSYVCRCLSVQLAPPTDGTSTVAWESERGLSVLPFEQPPAPATLPTPTPAEVLSLYQIVQPSSGLIGGDGSRLVLLAARRAPDTIALKVWLQVDDLNSPYELGTQRQFAVFGTLHNPYPADLPPIGTEPPDDDSGTLALHLDSGTVEADRRRIEDPQTADGINDNALLVWIFKASNPRQYELCTVKSTAIAANGSMILRVRRARYATTQLGFEVGDRAFIFHRTNLIALDHALFSQYQLTNKAATFRLQTANPQSETDLADPASSVVVTYTFFDPFAPTATWLAVTANGATITNFNAEFRLDTKFEMRVEAKDPTNDLTDVNISATLQGQDERTLVAKTLQPTGGHTLVYKFKPTSLDMDEGDWRFWAEVRDRSARVRRFQMTQGPGGPEVFLKLRADITNPGNTLVPPTITPPPGTYTAQWNFLVRLATSTTGATIEFQVGDYGVQTPGPNWVPYNPVGFMVSVGQGAALSRTVFARTIKGGTRSNPSAFTYIYSP